ncbi:DUF3846 domain-containing protein [Cytobacillus sp. Sa5YUA1]|uniref:DUF3846 domain-containing protein n=1 Tax=Cytobacillus stercorigallinarum TaxID=2762240 RepID=A0ABR8QK76_9BACI|nr:DUF3846 domain-containing protein [Cytobacillus stercorigallinarum]MBD7935936.1 DUF3846 domain-containing protein [Cytobacillus stercorigallinarum]
MNTNITEKTIRIEVVTAMVGEDLKAVTLENSLESFHNILGGSVDVIELSHGIYIYINGKGLVDGSKGNFIILNENNIPESVVAGNAIFACQDEQGNITGLTDQQVELICDLFIDNKLMRLG